MEKESKITISWTFVVLPSGLIGHRRNGYYKGLFQEHRFYRFSLKKKEQTNKKTLLFCITMFGQHQRTVFPTVVELIPHLNKTQSSILFPGARKGSPPGNNNSLHLLCESSACPTERRRFHCGGGWATVSHPNLPEVSSETGNFNCSCVNI